MNVWIVWEGTEEKIDGKKDGWIQEEEEGGGERGDGMQRG